MRFHLYRREVDLAKGERTFNGNFLTGVLFGLTIKRSLKERFDESVIDSVCKKVAENKTKDFKVHFVYAGAYYLDRAYNKLKAFILKALREYELRSVTVTMIYLERWNLITKEERDDYCLGKDAIFRKSVNEDLESLFEDVRLGEKTKNVRNALYFIPKLTTSEMELI